MIVRRQDSWGNCIIHTLASTELPTPFWLESEIDAALGSERSTTAGLIDGVDIDHLEASPAYRIFEAVGVDNPPFPRVTVLYPTGLSLACAGQRFGGALRSLLLRDAAKAVVDELARARLRRELAVLLADDAIMKGVGKSYALPRLFEAAIRSGLPGDADTMARMVALLNIAAPMRTSTRGGIPDPPHRDDANAASGRETRLVRTGPIRA